MNDRYEAIIIGAGVGGLTAGAYLAQAGLKALIIERHEKVGGYCGSFNHNGYRFDEAVHYINHMRRGGVLNRISHELGVDKFLDVLTIDPSDRLIMPGICVNIHHDWKKTVQELSEMFAKESKSLNFFFHMLTNFDFASLYVKYKNLTFQELLDVLFKNIRLKTALGLFATTMGLSADKLSALGALAYYKGSILDGGYHPVGGAQSFSDALRKCFEQFGGKVILRKTVSRILVISRKVNGVELDDGTRFYSKTVVSNADATHTYKDLVGEEHVGHEFINRLKLLKPSLSLIVVYLGVETLFNGQVPSCCNLWYFPYTNLRHGSINIVDDDRPDGYVHIGLSSLHDRSLAPDGCESLVVFCGASYMTSEYWQANKKRLGDVLVERACHAIPSIRGKIRIKLVASPSTLYRYTLNREGAYRGWEITPNQTQWELVRQKSSIEGFYLTGHWITTPAGNGGVSAVAMSGKHVAQMIVRSIEKRKPLVSVSS